MDLDAIRAQTPGVKHGAYLLNAGAGLMPTSVLNTVKDHLELEMSVGGYPAADARSAELEAVYDSCARLINADREEIAVTENATVAWQMAFYSLRFRPGDRILTAQAEYAANYLAYLQARSRYGVEIDVIPNDGSGQIDPVALEAAVDERVRLISVTWIPTNGGLVNPAAKIGSVARRHGVPYLLDACQAVGQLPVDVDDLQCDMLSATGRKFLRGPRGTGFLYIRRQFLELMEPPVIDHFAASTRDLASYVLRPDARRFETWENSYALRLGLRAAIDYALDIGIDAIQERCAALSSRLRQAIASLPRAHVYDLGTQPCAIVSFTVDGLQAEKVVAYAASADIRIDASSPNSSPLDAAARSLPTVVRASPHYYNTFDEVDRLVSCIEQL